MELLIKDYLDYLRTQRKVSNVTIDNYRRAHRAVNVDSVDVANLAKLWATLSKLLDDGMSYGYIQNFNALVGGMLNLHNIDSKSFEYNVFREKLGKLMKNSPSAYTEEQVKILLKEARPENKDVYKLIIFLTYTGCRIGGAKGLKFSMLKEVPGFDKVLAMPIQSKGHTYNAIISKAAVKELQFYAYGTDSMFGERRDTLRTSFEQLHRSALAGIIQRSGVSKDVTIGTAIFHSLRKFFTICLVNDGCESDSISLLLGQVPNTLAYKTYATAHGATLDRLTERTAEAYSKSRFVKWNIWEGL